LHRTYIFVMSADNCATDNASVLVSPLRACEKHYLAAVSYLRVTRRSGRLTGQMMLRLPLLQAETTLINFTVTEAGLEDQLLALVVDKERPDLEETKTQLIIQNSEFTIKLKQVGLSLHCVM
jgi:hypothetical protein